MRNPLGPIPAEYWPPPALANTKANKPINQSMALGQWLLTAMRQRGETRTVWGADTRARQVGPGRQSVDFYRATGNRPASQSVLISIFQWEIGQFSKTRAARA